MFRIRGIRYVTFLTEGICYPCSTCDTPQGFQVDPIPKGNFVYASGTGMKYERRKEGMFKSVGAFPLFDPCFCFLPCSPPWSTSGCPGDKRQPPNKLRTMVINMERATYPGPTPLRSRESSSFTQGSGNWIRLRDEVCHITPCWLL